MWCVLAWCLLCLSTSFRVRLEREGRVGDIRLLVVGGLAGWVRVCSLLGFMGGCVVLGCQLSCLIGWGLVVEKLWVCRVVACRAHIGG